VHVLLDHEERFAELAAETVDDAGELLWLDDARFVFRE
jgi:hypothetical protein